MCVIVLPSACVLVFVCVCVCVCVVALCLSSRSSVLVSFLPGRDVQGSRFFRLTVAQVPGLIGIRVDWLKSWALPVLLLSFSFVVCCFVCVFVCLFVVFVLFAPM